MADITVDSDFLRRFEAGLDPLHPERSVIPAQVLGYGEISTVIAMEGGDPNLVYKRMPLFHSEAEAAAYAQLYNDSQAVYADIGVQTAPGAMVWFAAENGRYTVIYLAQQKLPVHAIANKTVHQLDAAAALTLFAAVLGELQKVFAFNETNRGQVEVGFDGQLSNWAVADLDPAVGGLPDPVQLVYFDTNSPLLRKNGAEQLNAEIFLRSAPSFLVGLLKRLYLEEITTRYYDPRKVVIDLLGNLYKEQRPELIPDLVGLSNEYFAGRSGFSPITPDEVQRYYREDAFIWRLYLSSRRLDRTLHRLWGKPYIHILPGKIKR